MLSADETSGTTVDTEEDPDGTSDSRSTGPDGAPSGGSATPTNATPSTSRKSRFLDLGPITGFLRSRYPSSGKTEPTVEASHGVSADANTAETHSLLAQEADPDDEDDRRTIRGARVDATEAQDKTTPPLGQENGAEDAAVMSQNALEKLQTGTSPIPTSRAGDITC